MSTGLKANSDGSAAIQVGGTDVITLTSGGAATFVTSPTTVQAGTAAAPSITFSGDTNTGIYSPGADTIAFTEGGVESMRLNSSGNLGLGVTPSTRFNMVTNSDNQYTGGFRIERTTTPGQRIDITYNGVGRFTATDTALSNPSFAWHLSTNGTSSTQAMTLDASGNLGINTTALTGRLTIRNDSTTAQPFIDIVNRAPSSTFTMGGIRFASYRDVADPSYCAAIWSVVDAPSYNDGNLIFGTAQNGTSSLPTERARVSYHGYFKATSTGAYSAGTTGAVHEFNTSSVNGTIVNFYNQAASNPNGIYVNYTAADPNDATRYVFGAQQNTGVWIYRIYSNGTVAARSDVKWKKNIETTRDGYAEDLAKLRVVKYNWYNHEDGTPKELGLIAQEVEQVFPGLVTTDEQTRNEIKTREIPAVLDEEGNEVEPARTEEYTEKVGTGEYSKSIKFSVLPIMLLKAIQEQQAMIDELKAKVAALEGA